MNIPANTSVVALTTARPSTSMTDEEIRDLVGQANRELQRLSRLGDVLAHTCAPQWTAPTAEVVTVVDHLARVHWKRPCWVEHKTFGRGTALYRKQLDNGAFAVVVDYGVIERTLALDAAYWITPIEVLQQVKIQKEKEFKFRDGSPSTMERPFQYFWQIDLTGVRLKKVKDKPICLRRGIEPRTIEVIPQFGVGGHSTPITIDARSKNFCPLCDGLLTEGRYICAAHPQTYATILKANWERVLKGFEQAKNVMLREQANVGLGVSPEKQLDCARRRYVTVCRMFRKNTISKSAVHEAKEHLMGLLKQEQPEDALTIVRHYVRHGAEELSFVRQQDLSLVMEL